MEIFNVKDRLPTSLMLSGESTEVLAWLVMENKWVMCLYDYNNSVWQFAERGYPVEEKYDRVSHWCNLPKSPKEEE